VFDDIVLSVPESLTATYLVPCTHYPEDPFDAVDAYLLTLDEPLRELVQEMLDNGRCSIDVAHTSEVQPPISGIVHRFRGDPSADVVTAADYVAVIVVVQRPGWPPAHELSARVLAAGVARTMDVPVIDMEVRRLISIADLERTYPDASGRISLTSWVGRMMSPEAGEAWITTKGLGRFGLPELQVDNVPVHLGRAWGDAIIGLAHALLGWWTAAATREGDPAFVELPSLFTFGRRDVAAAYGDAPDGDDGAVANVTVRLELDPSLPSHDTFLTVLPPIEYPGPAADFFAEIGERLFG
jgi:hypothetical protein